MTWGSKLAGEFKRAIGSVTPGIEQEFYMAEKNEKESDKKPDKKKDKLPEFKSVDELLKYRKRKYKV